jgi:tight adherence protein B
MIADLRVVAAAVAAALVLLARPSSVLSGPVARVPPTVLAAVLVVPIGWLVMVRALPAGALVVSVAAALALAKGARRRRANRDASDRRDAAIEACGGLAADLRAGRPPVRALGGAADDWPEFRPVADAAALDADVAAAMRRLAGMPGCSSLRWVAGSWVLAHRSGAGLAGAVDLAVTAMVEERSTARVLETELASARATARLLSVLPLGVLLIGSGAGGDPFGFLLGTLPGTACLSCGLGLAWAGTSWIERIASGIEA